MTITIRKVGPKLGQETEILRDGRIVGIVVKERGRLLCYAGDDFCTFYAAKSLDHARKIAYCVDDFEQAIAAVMEGE